MSLARKNHAEAAATPRTIFYASALLSTDVIPIDQPTYPRVGSARTLERNNPKTLSSLPRKDSYAHRHNLFKICEIGGICGSISEFRLKVPLDK